MESFEYYGDYSSLEEAMEGMLGMSFVGNLWSSLISIATYVLMAIGLYTIAKRRGIRNPWLAWIPFGSTWLLGCVSDQYRYVTRGQEKSKRKVMLGLEIATMAVGVVSIVLMFVALISMFSRMDMEPVYGSDAAYMAEVLGPMMIALVLCFVMLGLAIALMVLQYMALYDLFNSCNPSTSAVFLALSILIGGVLQAIFVFVFRNKDLGMPLRQDQVIYNQPVFQPQQPTWQPPQQTTWQPPQPPVEPWERNIEE